MGWTDEADASDGASQLNPVFDRRLTYHGIDVRPLRVRRMDLMWRQFMATDPVAVVVHMVDAYNARDIDRFLDCYSPDAVIEDGSGKVLRQGRDAMRGFYGQLFAQSPQLHCAVRQRIHVGPYVIDEEAVSGIHLDGFPTELRAAAVYLVEKDLIARVRMLG